MASGKIARLPHQIRQQLNHRIQDGEQGKSILKWLNSLPEVQAVLDADFNGRSIAPCNLTEWKERGYRDWQIRQDALDTINNSDEPSLDSRAFNERLARCVSIHYAAAAQSLLSSELDANTKWSRLHQLCADVSRLRRADLHADRIDIERKRLALQQSKADQDHEAEFAQWLDRPETRDKYFPKERRPGISREALTVLDNYLMEGISPLDPEEAKKLYPFGQFATKPPVGFEPSDAPKNGKDDVVPQSTSASEAPSASEVTVFALSPETAAAPAAPAQPEAPPKDLCPKCQKEQPPLTPEGKRPFSACWFCGERMLDPGAEICPGCWEQLPDLDPNGQRPHPDCRRCGVLLPPPRPV
jgi:hypothetical protein